MLPKRKKVSVVTGPPPPPLLALCTQSPSQSFALKVSQEHKQLLAEEGLTGAKKPKHCEEVLTSDEENDYYSDDEEENHTRPVKRARKGSRSNDVGLSRRLQPGAGKGEGQPPHPRCWDVRADQDVRQRRQAQHGHAEARSRSLWHHRQGQDQARHQTS